MMTVLIMQVKQKCIESVTMTFVNSTKIKKNILTAFESCYPIQQVTYIIGKQVYFPMHYAEIEICFISMSMIL